VGGGGKGGGWGGKPRGTTWTGCRSRVSKATLPAGVVVGYHYAQLTIQGTKRARARHQICRHPDKKGGQQNKQCRSNPE